MSYRLTITCEAILSVLEEGNAQCYLTSHKVSKTISGNSSKYHVKHKDETIDNFQF